MGDHDAPAGWLQRWQDTEPLRLYLYGIVVPLLGAAVTYGLLTTEQLGAWLAVAGAALLGVGALERVRRIVWAPAAVDDALTLTDRRAYADGLRDSDTEHDAQPATAHMRSLGRCRNVERGNRCTLPPHPEAVAHRYE